jgi:hypothetical protein
MLLSINRKERMKGNCAMNDQETPSSPTGKEETDLGAGGLRDRARVRAKIQMNIRRRRRPRR